MIVREVVRDLGVGKVAGLGGALGVGGGGMLVEGLGRWKGGGRVGDMVVVVVLLLFSWAGWLGIGAGLGRRCC